MSWLTYATRARVTMSAEWMPGQPRPPYLDGSAPGYVVRYIMHVYIFCLVYFSHLDVFLWCRDFGFDPLGLGEVPENLERFKESELIHCRWAMLAVVCTKHHTVLEIN